MTTEQMEIAITTVFGAFPLTRYVVIPRTRWGLKEISHECDLLALSRSGTITEIEIKISKSDLLAEKRKRHNHECTQINSLYFAVPDKLIQFAEQHIPETAGLISCGWNHRKTHFTSTVIRPAKKKKSEKPTEDFIKHMYELLACRYWSERSRIIERVAINELMRECE